MKKSPYETLGVDKTASAEDIKKAHRKKVAKTHPDKGGNKEEFLAVQRSYEILSDDERRKCYDETGNADDKPSKEERCMTELGTLAIQCVGDLKNAKHTDVVKIMRDIITGGIEKMKELREGRVIAAERYRDAAKRFKSKKGTENVFEIMLSKQAQDFENDVKKSDEEIEISEMCLEILKAFKYEFEKQPEDPFESAFLKAGFKVTTVRQPYAGP